MAGEWAGETPLKINHNFESLERIASTADDGGLTVA